MVDLGILTFVRNKIIMETFSLIVSLVCLVLFVTLLIHHLRNNNKGEQMSNFDLLIMIILLFGLHNQLGQISLN